MNRPISLDEALETALANNDAFHATLAQMGMADGDYLQASLLTNPNLSTFIPVSVKQWEWTLFVPIETFLLRPERMAIADKDCERIAHQLVQNGMILVRDVQVAYANLNLAAEQHRLAEEALSIRQDIAGLTEKRLQEGDIAELEAIQTRVDVLNARANAALLEQNVAIAREQLALLMGIPEYADRLQIVSTPVFSAAEESVQELIDNARSNRPDLQAAQWAVAAAEARLRLSHKVWWRMDGVIDANGSGEKGYEMGPGLRFDIPIFNRNQGGIARATAELEAAKYNRDQILDQIVQQIRLASIQERQANSNYNVLRSDVLPTLDEAREIATKGFEDGGTSYLLVLQTTSQYLDVKARMLEQEAAVRRARAELELNCGRRLPRVLSKPIAAPPAKESVEPAAKLPAKLPLTAACESDEKNHTLTRDRIAYNRMLQEQRHQVD
jgi:cobalt-zinc-cadmium efflux system outer membrane protein